MKALFKGFLVVVAIANFCLWFWLLSKAWDYSALVLFG